MKGFLAIVLTSMFAVPAFAGFQGFNGSTNVGVYDQIQCSTGMTCSKNGSKFKLVSSPAISAATLSLSSTLGVTGASTLTGGLANGGGVLKNFGFRWNPSSLTAGTEVTPGATTVYLTQVYVPLNATITGVKVNNGATVGTNKYVVALFDSSGAAVANSALAGALTSGANTFQAVAFTSTYAVKGPGVYWIGLYVNGTTDTFRALPAVAEIGGYAGSVTGQTFGTVAAVTPPTSFTADKGPVSFLY